MICDKAFQIVAIIELDDSTHDRKGAKDNERDRMLKSAGYTVLRYRQIPDAERVKSDIDGLK
ncbi:hypothetical protein GALL_455490 [mine drainage metagenome]|uniref:DUF559 domain-containing protein n=1 Tax=mine drainage metagenome TaxID=410659 RepID=A0A1J5PMU4_9ZZZZ